MRYFKFDGLTLKIRRTNGRRQIGSTTPQIDFLKSHKKDIQAEIGAIRKMCCYISESIPHPIRSIWDLMAGCGFGYKIFEKYLRPNYAVLNDMDSICVDILETNILKKNVDITPFNFLEFPFKSYPNPDFVFIDFNNFTLRRIDEWKEGLKKINSRLFAITDSACYGFKFGNLNKYGFTSEIDYYYAVDEIMRGNYGYAIESIFPFGPACLILMTNRNIKKIHRIERETSQPIPIEITTYDSKGFGL